MGSNRREGHEPEILDTDDIFAGIESLAPADAHVVEEQTVHPKMVCDTCGSPEGQCMHFGGVNYSVVPQEQYDALPGEEPTSEVPNGTVQQSPELDSSGYPWDERIHGKARNINKDGTWRLIRGIDKDLVARVRAETVMAAQQTPEGDEGDPWVCDQCGVAGGTCEHNQGQGGFGVIRKSEFCSQPVTDTVVGSIGEGSKQASPFDLNAQTPPEKPPPKKTGITADMVIGAFVKTRDEIAELGKKHKAELAKLNDVQEKRSMWLNGELQRQGLESFKTSSGTCFMDMKDRANVADGAAFMKWVGADFEKNKHFLENRVSKAAVKQRLEDGELAPPGVNYTTVRDVKIRRA